MAVTYAWAIFLPFVTLGTPAFFTDDNSVFVGPGSESRRATNAALVFEASPAFDAAFSASNLLVVAERTFVSAAHTALTHFDDDTVLEAAVAPAEVTNDPATNRPKRSTAQIRVARMPHHLSALPVCRTTRYRNGR